MRGHLLVPAHHLIVVVSFRGMPLVVPVGEVLVLLPLPAAAHQIL